jgi:hypothetical protein
LALGRRASESRAAEWPQVALGGGHQLKIQQSFSMMRKQLIKLKITAERAAGVMNLAAAYIFVLFRGFWRAETSS